MVTMDKLEAVIRIDLGHSCGSCFTLAQNGKQYIVTARHLLGPNPAPSYVRVWLFDQWHKVSVKVVGSDPLSEALEHDALVLSCSEQVSPFSLSATRGSFYLSQDVYFLGYPYNMATDKVSYPNISLPLIKKSIVSGVIKSGLDDDFIVLDGYNNSGFSGGPVITALPIDGHIRTIGIISGYRTDFAPVDNDRDLFAEVNAGMIYVTPMKRVLDYIDTNPIGCPISEGWDWHSSRFVSR